MGRLRVGERDQCPGLVQAAHWNGKAHVREYPAGQASAQLMTGWPKEEASRLFLRGMAHAHDRLEL